jgi:hypothetical protein
MYGGIACARTEMSNELIATTEFTETNQGNTDDSKLIIG